MKSFKRTWYNIEMGCYDNLGQITKRHKEWIGAASIQEALSLGVIMQELRNPWKPCFSWLNKIGNPINSFEESKCQ